MKTAKLGAIFLISIMALAGVGAGYAAWIDIITITGTINTGDVDLVVEKYSGTWVYKDLVEDTIEIDTGWLSTATYTFTDSAGVTYKCTRDQSGTPQFELVAFAYSEAGAADDEIDMIYWGLFPCIDFVADVLLHYDGSIPVKVNDFGLPVITGDGIGDWIPGLIGMFNTVPLPDIYVVAYRCDSTGYPIDDLGVPLIADDLFDIDTNPDYDAYEIVSVGTQLHYCDYIMLELHIHIPQDDQYMARTGGFTAQIGVVQWNEYPYTPP